MHFDDRYLHAELVDGRVILRPMSWYKASSLDERSEIEEISAQEPRFRVTPSRLLAPPPCSAFALRLFFLTFIRGYLLYISVISLYLHFKHPHKPRFQRGGK